MLASSFILLCLAIVSLRSRAHGMGLWLLILITHGLIYQIVGEGAAHLPFFSGVAAPPAAAGFAIELSVLRSSVARLLRSARIAVARTDDRLKS
jgi:hypothetical protein